MQSVMTGRYSSTTPNMSNIPRSEADKCIRIPNIFRTLARWLLTYCTNVVYICGDIHGNFNAFSQKLHILKMQRLRKHVYVFVCGDFGHWPNYWPVYRDWETDRKSTRLNSSHSAKSRMPSSA